MSPWRPLFRPGDENGPRPVSASLGPLARRLGAPQPAVLTAVFAGWEELVGPVVAAHALPLSLTGGALVIGADHPGWATELRYLGTDLLDRLAERLGPGHIERLEVKVLPPRRA